MTTTPQAALLSDEEIIRHLEAAGVNFQRFMGGIAGTKDCWTTSGSQDARTIGAGVRAILAKLQATQAEPVQAGEFPPLPVFSTSRVIQEAVEQYATDYARAALSARKPAVPAVEPMLDKHWYWISYEGLGHTYHAAAMYKANVDCFYSYEFSGVPAREVTVHHGIGLEVKP